MTNRKRKKLSVRRHSARLEPKLAAVEAQMAHLETDDRLGLAAQDYFVLWRRPALFVPWPSELLQ